LGENFISKKKRGRKVSNHVEKKVSSFILISWLFEKNNNKKINFFVV